jgi:O-methyltransferase involved in polyketide biosynthesis
MGITLPTLTPVEDSLLLTLYCKALDSRLPKPLLSDATADEERWLSTATHPLPSGQARSYAAPSLSPAS